ncbi:MAG: hypothetical protein Fur0015_03700 [Ignavibacteriales bacterium]
MVVNNLQPKIKGVESEGVGLNNLRKRYELLGEELPHFTVTEKKNSIDKAGVSVLSF